MSNMKKQKVAVNVPLVASTLLSAVEAARKAAQDNMDDGGTCNLDSVVIDTSIWSIADVRKISAATGNMIGDKLSSSWWKGYRWVRFNTGIHGQANLNTRQVNAFYKYCKDNGIDNVSIYSQMD